MIDYLKRTSDVVHRIACPDLKLGGFPNDVLARQWRGAP